jgi:hypothetical protein
MRLEINKAAFKKASSEPLKPKPTQGFRKVLNEGFDRNTAQDSRQEGDTQVAPVEPQAPETLEDGELNSASEDSQSEEGSDSFEQANEEASEQALSGEELDEELVADTFGGVVQAVLIDIEETELVAGPVVIPIATEITSAFASGPAPSDSAPILNDWSNAFTAQAGEQLVTDEVLLTNDETDSGTAKHKSAPLGLDGGIIALPKNFQATNLNSSISLDLNQPQSSNQLAELVELQIQNSKTPDGAKRLSVSLNPEGFGRLRINATNDGSVMRVKLQIENADASKMIEQLMPQLEAQIAASVAMPVEFELVQEDLIGDDELAQQFTEDDGAKGEQTPEGQDASSELVSEWTQALEDPVLGRGQTLHVVA